MALPNVPPNLTAAFNECRQSSFSNAGGGLLTTPSHLKNEEITSQDLVAEVSLGVPHCRDPKDSQVHLPAPLAALGATGCWPRLRLPAMGARFGWSYGMGRKDLRTRRAEGPASSCCLAEMRGRASCGTRCRRPAADAGGRRRAVPFASLLKTNRQLLAGSG